MGISKQILKKYFVVVPDKFAISVKVTEVPDSSLKYPEGVKASFVLLDLTINLPVVLVDNHAPFGFHLHPGLPEDKNLRKELKTSSYEEAYRIFMEEVSKYVENFKNKN